MINIYLVRHGETDWNNQGIYQGWSDIPLNANGLRQAKECAHALESVVFDRIITSDLVRARVTAETILGEREIPFIVDDRLREINFGEWEGLTYDEIDAQWEDVIHQMYATPHLVKVPGGDDLETVQARAWAAVKDGLEGLSSGSNLLIVCHGGTIRTLLCKLVGIPVEFIWRFRQGNTAINIINYYGKDSNFHTVQLMNDTSHTTEQLYEDC